MIKSSIIMISAFVLFIAGSSVHTEEKIIINQNFPSAIKAGDEFTVTLNIHKSAITGFARLQQDLPAGFTAEEIESKGADFIFDDHHIKLIWLKIPVESDFTVSYKIKTEKNISGHQVINGMFVYMDNDKTQRQNLTPVEINIEARMITASPAPQVARRLLSIAPEKGEYRVELIIHPNNTNEPAQFTDEIPENFTAELIDAYEAAFSFEKHSVVFNWSKLPSDSVFTISYTVKSGKAGVTPIINGVFLYGDVTNEQTAMKEVPLSEDFSNTTKEQPAKIDTIDQNAPLADTKTVISDKKLLPVAEKGITYKVQISATQKSSVKNSYWFTSKYQINSDVELTYHEGWKKYLIGSFQAYKEASNFRKQTREKIPDAFVVAYENGMRIPVSVAIRSKSLNQ